MASAEGVHVDPVASRRRYASEAQRLVGGICPSCDRRFWPRRAMCPDCATVLAECLLQRDGTLLTWTQAHVPLAGIIAPYTLALVDLDGARVFTHLKSGRAPEVPSPVRVQIDLEQRPPFWVVPTEEDDM